MSTDRPKSSTTMSFLDLEAEDRRRKTTERRRKRLQDRLAAAFEPFPRDSEETPTADLVRNFLTFVAGNIDGYRNRTRVQNPHTGEVVEEEWVTLCGATIQAMEAPPRIKQLVLELVAALIPDEDPDHRRLLARASGMSLRARASADAVKTLQKKGIMGAFGGKLLVDTKHLVAQSSAEEAAAYFDAARRIAGELEDSPYRTERDHRFLELLDKSYQGGLVALVDAQREQAEAEIADRSEDCPRLEHTLRSMLETPFLAVSGRSIEDWFISARIAFQNEAYVFMRLDEFRAHLKKELVRLEAEPMLNPEAALEELTPRLEHLVGSLTQSLAEAAAGLSYSAQERVDVFQLVRSNAALLGKPEVVEAYNLFIGDPGLLEVYARFKYASFKRDEPDLREKLHSDLIMWDEIFRSAPLSGDQRARLTDLRESILAQLTEWGLTVPEDQRLAKMLLPFAGPILPLLRREAEFTAFQTWLERVQRVYNERLGSDEELAVPEAEELLATPQQDSGPTTTQPWYPTLVDLEALRSGPRSPGEPQGDSPRDRPRTGWLRKWFGGD